MFIALRDVRHAKGRFALIGSVIAMMTFLVVALSALTNGLADATASAVRQLPGTSLVLQSAVAGQKPALTRSSLDDSAVAALTREPGASRLGVTTTRVEVDGRAAALTVFGADPALMPTLSTGAAPGAGAIVLNAESVEDLGVAVGSTVTVSGKQLTVSGIGDTRSFLGTPVGYTTVDSWRGLGYGQNVGAVVLDSPAPSPALPGTVGLPMERITDTVPGFSSENSSLMMIQGLLLAISALVVGSFFAVWTAQRLRQLAVVRALGASRRYLLRDGLGQVLLVLVLGEAVGASLGVALALGVSTVPMTVTASGLALPVVGMAVLGTVGALLTLRRVVTVDPLIALSA
ncbi:ABC transporter permease [Kitasatospora purpeofusca]|uniref:ABC transporter permease n=1 Tax=Kitasatospora purpeofusca TaxID=67352 RepID=UPI003655A131